ncbi:MULTISPECIES: cytochrome c maturation protein CcmE [unclassified Saccharibacter]|nr:MULTISPECIES: cytochrome c maturation protein CcmE [unclassified Saccharibacter]MXV35236.1 cytochrome c maturation protein CcmE [Saccharibacter sp. EH611]MXV57217.1 cytochrome c maturation protein CcmE [Saccharibacter sp. EH70]MXV64922.1 cytochrome c maturation protein CcmE [Saccharibacter sp. EH60]
MTRSRRLSSSRSIGRLWIVTVCLLCLSGATALTLYGLSNSLVFFMAPSQLLNHPPPPDRTIRLGGMVVAGSVHKNLSSAQPEIRFDVTDGQAAITVHYYGIVPDLFREGQSIVAIGHPQTDGVFLADDVLAKHDETYMPKDVADALQRSGKWDPRFGPPPNAASWNAMTATPKETHP